MLKHSVLLCCILQLTLAAPQFVTFKDGRIGVNFGGYSADAGLGGLLTGNAADGGLSASAGTPWGPRAAAGINGGVGGNAAGGAYAGAQYSPSVGASSVIGGTAGSKGFAGAEAHADGKTVTKTVGGATAAVAPPAPAPAPAPAPQPQVVTRFADVENTVNVQKIKPPKKYVVDTAGVNGAAQAKVVSKSVYKQVAPPVVVAPVHTESAVLFPRQEATYATTGVKYSSGNVVNSALNIPIGILRSLQDSLGGLQFQKSVSVTSST